MSANSNNGKPFYQSKRWWSAVLTPFALVLVPWLQQKLGVQVDATMLAVNAAAIVATVVGYIVGETRRPSGT